MAGFQPTGDVPRRVWILGVTGSGKTTLVKRWGEIARVPAYDMDDLYWRPGWIGASDTELYDAVDQRTRQEAWVVGGNYNRVRTQFAERVDRYVWIDLPFRTSFARLCNRTWRRCREGTSICNGNHETLAKAFLDKDSILLWAITQHRRQRAKAAATAAAHPTWHLRSPRDVATLEAWLKAQYGAS